LIAAPTLPTNPINKTQKTSAAQKKLSIWPATKQKLQLRP